MVLIYVLSFVLYGPWPLHWSCVGVVIDLGPFSGLDISQRQLFSFVFSCSGIDYVMFLVLVMVLVSTLSMSVMAQLLGVEPS